MIAGPFPGFAPIPEGLQEIMQVFGSFVFTELSHGLVSPESAWVKANVLRLEHVPVLNQALVCHKSIAPALLKVFSALEAKGLAGEIKTCEGCYWPRYKMHDPRRGLSTHSWGIALDLNAASNPPGTRGDMNENVIEVFGRHGFYWGGNFNDPMHFQYARGY
jgi:hypothetical protein